MPGHWLKRNDNNNDAMTTSANVLFYRAKISDIMWLYFSRTGADIHKEVIMKKRYLQLLTTLLLTLVMMLGLIGCGSDDGSTSAGPNGTWNGGLNSGSMQKDSVVGTWSSTFSLDAFDSDQIPQEILDQMHNTALTFLCLWTFEEDGSMVVAFDENSLISAIDSWMDDYLNACEIYYTEYYADLGTSLSEVLANSGYSSFREMIDMSGVNAQKEQLKENARNNFNQSGTYQTDGDKLYLMKDGESQDNYFTFCFENGNLILTGSSKGDPNNILPMTLTRR